MVGIFRLQGQHQQDCNKIFTIVLETDLCVRIRVIWIIEIRISSTKSWLQPINYMSLE